MDLHFASFQAHHDADAGFRLPGENHSQLCSRADLPLLTLGDRVIGENYTAQPALPRKGDKVLTKKTMMRTVFSHFTQANARPSRNGDMVSTMKTSGAHPLHPFHASEHEA